MRSNSANKKTSLRGNALCIFFFYFDDLGCVLLRESIGYE